MWFLQAVSGAHGMLGGDATPFIAVAQQICIAEPPMDNPFERSGCIGEDLAVEAGSLQRDLASHPAPRAAEIVGDETILISEVLIPAQNGEPSAIMEPAFPSWLSCQYAEVKL